MDATVRAGSDGHEMEVDLPTLAQRPRRNAASVSACVRCASTLHSVKKQAGRRSAGGS